MRHFPHSRFQARTFTDTVLIQLDGHKGAHGAEFTVEVEFTETPTVPAQLYGPPEHCSPAEGGEREIVAVRAFVSYVETSCGFDGVRKVVRKRDYYDIPDWMKGDIEACINVDALNADWTEGEL